jgi:hypothetical protein
MSDVATWAAAVVGVFGGFAGIASFGFNWNRGRRRLKVRARRDGALNDDTIWFEIHNHGAHQEVVKAFGLRDWRGRTMWPVARMSAPAGRTIPQDTTAVLGASGDWFVEHLGRQMLGRFPRAIVTTEQGRSYRGRVRRDLLHDAMHLAFMKAVERQSAKRRWYRRFL